ncbi:MAG: asparaginase [Thermomicrobiales bacterium]|nr:MAG: asparaginase [Thermomicrobiales bacterium]
MTGVTMQRRSALAVPWCSPAPPVRPGVNQQKTRKEKRNVVVTRLAEVTRGGRVESVHDGSIVVSDASGTVIAWAGDPEQFAFFRSSAKPFQAIPVVESGAADRFGLTDAELALCCASHNAERRHQEQVAAMLTKLGLSPEALRCGCPLPSDAQEAGRVLAGLVPPSPLHCDCSGKHAGMLASCWHLGYPLDDYRKPDHPLQHMIRQIIAEVCRVDAADLAVAVDGCSVPTFGATLAAFARAYAALAAPDRVPHDAGGAHASALLRLQQAMMRHPENVAGQGELVTDLMRLGRGTIVAKSGAEGLLCLGLLHMELGIAIRIADGSFRAHPVVAAQVLSQLDAVESSVIDEILGCHPPVVKNHNGWIAGEIRPAFQLQGSA